MSLALESLAAAPAKKSFRAKPYSVERRFQLVQSGTVVIALLLASLALYWNLSLQRRADASLRILRSTLALSQQLQSVQRGAQQAFWDAYDMGNAEARAGYPQRLPETLALLQQYDRGSLSAEESAKLDRVQVLEQRFFGRTAEMLAHGHHPNGDLVERAEVGTAGNEIESTLGDLEDRQIELIEGSSVHIARASIWMTILLLMSAAISLAAIGWSRREGKARLWSHLENLRHMVAEIRRGNLNVTADIPNSIELGSLIDAFVRMAAEIRDTRDSLERKVVERTASLELAQKDILQSAKLASLGQLVSGVAHEINNPLTAILGFSEVALFRSAPESTLNTQLRTIRSEALRLRHLVSNLTAFAHKAPHRTERIDLRTVLARLTDLHAYQLRVNNIFLHVTAAEEPVGVLADPEQLTQVILNLALNSEHAIKSSRERGEIWIACGSERGCGFFSVRDNGCGMAPEVRDHMFDPFFTTKLTGQGTGLGLSISYGIVQQHQGTIFVESTVGEGTTIRVEIPLASVADGIPAPPDETPEAVIREAETAPLPDSAPAPKETSAKPEPAFHALVIDDEESILELVSVALEPLNGRTTLLSSSSGVGAALAAGQFDLVISDLKMPGKNGAEVFRFIRENYPKLAPRFLLMTGNLADAEKYSFDLDAVPVLPKPFTIASLRQAVTALLRSCDPQ